MPGHGSEDSSSIRPPLEGKLVRLRAVEEEDLPRINEMFWDPEVTQFLAVVWPEPLAGTREWWARTRTSETAAAFAIETLPGGLIGGCSLESISASNRSAMLGIWIGKPYWDRGYGTDAVRTLCRFGFREMNLQRIWLGVWESNPRGRRAYENVGFKEEGRLRRAHFVGGRYVDAIVMGLLEEELIED